MLFLKNVPEMLFLQLKIRLSFNKTRSMHVKVVQVKPAKGI